MARATGLPPTGAVPIEVRLDRQHGREHWRRQFGTHVMASTLWQQGELLCERLGLVSFGFALAQRGPALDWEMKRVRALGVPLPARWFASVQARESADGALHLQCRCGPALVGLLVRYDGWLSPVPGDE